jgi:hypothetical protein
MTVCCQRKVLTGIDITPLNQVSREPAETNQRHLEAVIVRSCAHMNGCELCIVVSFVTAFCSCPKGFMI